LLLIIAVLFTFSIFPGQLKQTLALFQQQFQRAVLPQLS